MKISSKIICAAILNILCFAKSDAQGLSLSFNLTETDTLANMIADSKKYEIASLTLSGYVNSANTLYIIKLNKEGKLRNLDISEVSHFDYYTKRKYTYSSESGGNLYTVMKDLLKEYYPKSKDELQILLNENAPNHKYRLDMDSVIIEDRYKNNYLIRSFNFYYDDIVYPQGYSFEEHFDIPYSLECPKIALGNCKFSELFIPNSIVYVGGDDLTYSIAECKKYILGLKTCVFREKALMNSHIESIVLKSDIDSIKASAFENSTGNILTNSHFLESVIYIGENAFKNSSLIEKNNNETITLSANKVEKGAFINAAIPSVVSLPNVTEISDSTFMASNIMEVNLGNKITNIGINAFEKCSNLLVVKNGENISNIGEKAFYRCYKLNTFDPSKKLETIGAEAFVYDWDLASFSIPSTTKSVDHNAFANCGLKEINLGEYEGYRRDITFGCDKLETISVNSNNKKFKSINGVLHSKDGSKLIQYPCAKNGMYEINNNVTEISDSAFYGAINLSALSISESVRTIGKNAFAYSGIFEIKALPSTTPKVTENKSGLDQLFVRLYVHEKDFSTYYIANYWGDFTHIYSLEKAVSNTDNNIHVKEAGTLPELIGYGNRFKYDALRLSGYLNGDDICYIREMAGKDVNGNNTWGVLTDLDISQASIVKGGGSYYNKNKYSSGKLTTSDNEIGESMFQECNLKKVVISQTTTSIRNRAFYDCYKLISINIAKSVKSIGGNAFYGCYNLNYVTSLNPIPPTISSDSFQYYSATLQVPTGSKTAYQNANYWKKFMNIVEIAPTGIQTITQDKENNYPIYDLNGRRLESLQKGINIINGKKVLVK